MDLPYLGYVGGFGFLLLLAAAAVVVLGALALTAGLIIFVVRCLHIFVTAFRDSWRLGGSRSSADVEAVLLRSEKEQELATLLRAHIENRGAQAHPS